MRFLIVSCVTIFAIQAWAAIPQKPKDSLKKNHLPRKLELTKVALQLPIQQRIETLKLRGDESLESLVAIANSDEASLPIRWKAVTALGRVFPIKSKNALVSLSKSKDWFLRNASLISLKVAYRPLALEVAKDLLNDKALVVRTAAVQVIEEIGAREDARQIWSKINNPENFKFGKSLWIRAHMMRTLAKFATSGDELRFAGFVNDKDPKVQLWTFYGLERSSGGRGSSKKLSLQERRKKWTAWAKRQRNINDNYL